MPTTRRIKRSRSAKTMRAGGKKFTNANAAELKVPKYIKQSLNDIGEAAVKMASVFQSYHIDYYKGFGLLPARKKASKIFSDLEKLEEMIKKNKYYDKNVSSSPMYK